MSTSLRGSASVEPGENMRRRDFIALLGGAGASVSAPVRLTAQEPGRTYRLGVLIPVPRAAPAIVAFLQELRLHGFTEGQNLTIVPGGFDARSDQIAGFVAELVKAAPDAIISGGDPATRALQKATRTIPIVVVTEDVVAAGFAASLARPGGNVTGISLMSPELDGKRQDILIEAAPGARRIAALADSNVATLRHLEALEEAARTYGKELLIVRASNSQELISAITDASTRGATALNVLASPMLFQNRRVIMEQAAHLRLPSIYQWPETAEEGGLLGYGPRFVEVFRERGRMVARILAGSSPADMPVEQPTTFELVINLRTAKAIGHEVPAGLVLRADKVIE
jgi:putative ABC transport system substrate-binding protein